MDGYVDDRTGRCVKPEEECGCYDPLTGEFYAEGQVFNPEGDECKEWYVMTLLG